MLKNMLMVVAISTAAASAFAAPPPDQVSKAIPMKDGSTLYVFKDGKMAMENKTGHAVQMKQGEVMETKDGKKVMMHGNEVMQLEKILHKDHTGG